MARVMTMGWKWQQIAGVSARPNKINQTAYFCTHEALSPNMGKIMTEIF